MIHDELNPIRIPTEPNWTPQLDHEFVEGRTGDPFEGIDSLLMRCFDGMRDLVATLRCLLGDKQIDQRLDLKVPELIDLVEQRLLAVLPPHQYQQFLVDELLTCRFLNDECVRIMGIYVANPNLHWRAPLVDLGDWILSAKIWLEDGLATVFPDYERD